MRWFYEEGGLERWAAKVDVSAGSDGCWLWTAGKAGKGYGVIRAKGHGPMHYAHRVSWELFRFPIPNGLCVLHRCDVPACVNPSHLFLGTITENHADMHAKGRGVTGERVHNAKLTAPQVSEIKSALRRGVKQAWLARDHGVSPGLIYLISKGSVWKSVIALALALCLLSCVPKPCVQDREALWVVEQFRKMGEPCPERAALDEEMPR